MAGAMQIQVPAPRVVDKNPRLRVNTDSPGAERAKAGQ